MYCYLLMYFTNWENGGMRVKMSDNSNFIMLLFVVVWLYVFMRLYYWDYKNKKIQEDNRKAYACKHYDQEEINLVLDGVTKPVLRCRDCGRILNLDKNNKKER